MHTPGPWKTHAGASGQVHVMFGADGKYIGKVDAYPVRTIQEDEANARLIASAPSMLDTLDRIANGEFATNVSPAEQVAAMRDIARAAIAHATQEPTP